jgi:hypothetical protein
VKSGLIRPHDFRATNQREARVKLSGLIATTVLAVLALSTIGFAQITSLPGADPLIEVAGTDYDNWVARGRAGPICVETGKEIDRDDPTFPERAKCACATGAGSGEDRLARRVVFTAKVDWCHKIASTGVTGQWTYRDGGFSDKHFLNAGGQAFGTRDHNPDSKGQGTWSIAGTTLTVRWSNGWVNRYTLPANHATTRVAGELAGRGDDPTPGRPQRTITLTR